MSQKLFRPEVLAHRASWLGGISLAQPVGLWLLAGCAAGTALAVVLFLFLGSYTWRSNVSGQLVPTKGLAVVVAPAAGVVSELSIGEGDHVEKGQRLAVVTVPRTTVATGDTVTALERELEQRRQGLKASLTAQQEMNAAQEAGIRNQLVNARRELAHIDSEMETRKRQIRIAEETLQRFRQLQDEHYVSLLQINQQESSALSWKGELQSLERQAIATRRLIAQLQQSLRELPGQIRVSEATYQRDLAMLEQEQVQTQANGALSIHAPVDGAVSVQIVKAGQAVEQGHPLMVLLPRNSSLEAELHVPSRAIGFVEPGDTVLLRYQAYPYQKFGHHEGKVTRISRSALESDQGRAQAGDGAAGAPYYRVTVALAEQTVVAYGREEHLMPGMSLDADILGERRRLVEWLLEPVYSIKGIGK